MLDEEREFLHSDDTFPKCLPKAITDLFVKLGVRVNSRTFFQLDLRARY